MNDRLRAFLSQVRFRRWVTLVWIAYGALSSVQVYVILQLEGRAPVVWYGPIAASMIKVVLWALWTPFLVVVAQRIQFVAGAWLRPLLIHVTLAIGLWVVDAQCDAQILTFLRGARPPTMLAASLERLDAVFLYYFVIVLAVHLGRYYESTRSAERSASQLRSGLAEAELHLLRNQIRPHFLFNSLNVISELTREDPIRAGAMIEKLGDLLRLSLELGSSRTVPLATEIQLVSLYLDLQQTRFEEWLRFEVTVDPTIRSMPVPAFLLQPLVENAIQHGILPAMRPCNLRVSAARIASGVELVVRDDGVGLSSTGTLKKNIGLTNTEARLERLYGAEFAFTIQRAAPAGTEVVIRIPHRPQGGGHERLSDGSSATHDFSGPAVPERHSYA